MKAQCFILTVLFAFSLSAIAQNPTNKASVRVGEITIPTSGTNVNLPISALNLGYLRVDFSITPLDLSPSDAKGLSVQDGNGNSVYIVLDNDAPIQFSSFMIGQINKQVALQRNAAYDFTLFVGPTSATAWWRTKTAMVKLGTLTHNLVPPFSISVGTQRTGARFSDIIVKEQ